MDAGWQTTPIFSSWWPALAAIQMVCPGWSDRSWVQTTMVSLASMYSRRWRSFAGCVKSLSHSVSSSRMGAFLLQDSAGSPTSITRALLVTFVHNWSNCSSPRIPLIVSTIIDATCWPSWQTRLVLQEFSSGCRRVSAVVRPAWPRRSTGSGMCSFETQRCEFLPSCGVDIASLNGVAFQMCWDCPRFQLVCFLN